MIIEVFIWLSFPHHFFFGDSAVFGAQFEGSEDLVRSRSFKCLWLAAPPIFSIRQSFIITINHYKSPLIIMNHHRMHFCWRDHVMPRCLPLAELTRPNIAFQISTSALLSHRFLARREVEVSINRGTPKWMVFNGKFY